MASWGNEEHEQHDQDMISPAGRRLEVANLNAAASALKTTNSNANGLALEVVGRTYLGSLTTIEDNLTCNAECHVTETLFADAEANVAGHLNCEDDVDIDGQLQVGPANAAGEIDSGGDQNPQELRIGTNNVTTDVVIGRDGHDTLVRSDLKVGPADDAGSIESCGTTNAPQDLNIGTNGETNGIFLGRAGVTVDVQCQTRLNSNALIMNDALAINDANGCGQVFNAVGHPGPNMPCMDFYINGAVVGWVDANGWNNA
jgi:hypothetical protein